MTREELEKESEEWIKEHSGLIGSYEFVKYDYDSMQKAYLAGAEPREKQIAELEAQIEKMKNCKNCANYMISGDCPRLFRTGWCKNWEMTK